MSANPALGRVEGTQRLADGGAGWPVSLAERASSRFSRRPYFKHNRKKATKKTKQKLKQQQQEVKRRSIEEDIQLPPLASVCTQHTWVHISVHMTQRHIHSKDLANSG